MQEKTGKKEDLGSLKVLGETPESTSGNVAAFSQASACLARSVGKTNGVLGLGKARASHTAGVSASGRLGCGQAEPVRAQGPG